MIMWHLKFRLHLTFSPTLVAELRDARAILVTLRKNRYDIVLIHHYDSNCIVIAK